MKKLNNKGAALLIAYFVMSILVILSVGFALLSFNELNDARRYFNSTKAFWLAEAGVNQFIQNPVMLDKAQTKTVSQGGGTIYLKKDESKLDKRIVTSTGTFGGIKRTIQIEFPRIAPEVFNNVLSIHGDIEITGSKSTITFNDITRLSGKIINTSEHSIIFFEDKKEVTDDFISLKYPDMNNNSVPDEFDDFVQFNRKLISSYPDNEVIYIQGSGTYTIIPDSSLSGKKIIYVEGKQDEGNVVVQFNGAWEENQNLTIIATGRVTLNQAATVGANSQLNIIAWAGYSEATALAGSHNGIIYTHGFADFDEVHDTSITNGVVIANGGMRIREVWSHKTFNYRDPRADDVVPPGFEGLIGAGDFNYLSKPVSWKELKS